MKLKCYELSQILGGDSHGALYKLDNKRILKIEEAE